MVGAGKAETLTGSADDQEVAWGWRDQRRCCRFRSWAIFASSPLFSFVGPCSYFRPHWSSYSCACSFAGDMCSDRYMRDLLVIFHSTFLLFVLFLAGFFNWKIIWYHSLFPFFYDVALFHWSDMWMTYSSKAMFWRPSSQTASPMNPKPVKFL